MLPDHVAAPPLSVLASFVWWRGDGAEESEGTRADLLVNAFGTPNGHAPSDESADDEQPLNRASRRAQQREDAHAWRTQQR